LEPDKLALIRILQNAYSGEAAAAFAYRGHWRSLKPGPEKERVKQIEAEEWDHRERVGAWLRTLGAGPRPGRERLFRLIGQVLGPSCFVSGWFLPMYFAGRLESGNVLEYEEAAGYARNLNMDDCVQDLLDMARVEAEHEVFFKETVSGHRLLPAMKAIFRWG
jgi:rubrerythrin